MTRLDHEGHDDTKDTMPNPVFLRAHRAIVLFVTSVVITDAA